MNLLALKLFLTPLLVGIVSYIQKRWGDGVGGRVIGLPLTTGPFIFIIFIQEGSQFASRAAHGVLVGQIALIIYCWVYAKSALAMSWIPALGLSTIICILTGAILTSFEIRLLILLPILAGSWILAYTFWPKYSVPFRTSPPPPWELPARLVATVTVILTLTGLASLLGPRVAGALATYPVIISILGGFSQKRFGPNVTVATLHGLMQAIPLSIGIMTVLTVLL